MKLFSDLKPLYNLFEKDKHNREINIYLLKECVALKEHTFYPNNLFFSNNEIIKPLNEKVMSLGDNNLTVVVDTANVKVSKTIKDPVFFLVYNTENYYHFIYDTLPYLISFFNLKKKIPNLKLLMNYPNKEKKQHYKFVLEILNFLGINENQIEVINPNYKYDSVYVSNSYTHDGKSNLPPREEIYAFYKSMVKTSNIRKDKKLYISRRSWIHGDYSNIGTNYTSRRLLENETELVEYLKSLGFEEVFTENLSIKEKIELFSSASCVIGALGGGLCNVVFCDNANVIAIESPGFLKVNERFKFCLEKNSLSIFNKASHTEKTLYKKYMRVKYNDIIGEITNIENDNLTISYTDDHVAGWNNSREYKTITVKSAFCKKLDDGLNSSWTINLEEFKKYVY